MSRFFRSPGRDHGEESRPDSSSTGRAVSVQLESGGGGGGENHSGLEGDSPQQRCCQEFLSCFKAETPPLLPSHCIIRRAAGRSEAMDCGWSFRSLSYPLDKTLLFSSPHRAVDG
ncbi:unnamed protein product [Arctogadus glacialis]